MTLDLHQQKRKIELENMCSELGWKKMQENFSNDYRDLLELRKLVESDRLADPDFKKEADNGTGYSDRRWEPGTSR